MRAVCVGLKCVEVASFNNVAGCTPLRVQTSMCIRSAWTFMRYGNSYKTLFMLLHLQFVVLLLLQLQYFEPLDLHYLHLLHLNLHYLMLSKKPVMN